MPVRNHIWVHGNGLVRAYLVCDPVHRLALHHSTGGVYACVYLGVSVCRLYLHLAHCRIVTLGVLMVFQARSILHSAIFFNQNFFRNGFSQDCCMKKGWCEMNLLPTKKLFLCLCRMRSACLPLEKESKLRAHFIY